MLALQVRMLGSGRPFIVEISNSRFIPPSSEMAKLEMEINSLKEGWVSCFLFMIFKARQGIDFLMSSNNISFTLSSSN